MTAYMIVDIDINDADTYQEYREKAPAFVAKYGSEYLARSEDHQIIGRPGMDCDLLRRANRQPRL